MQLREILVATDLSAAAHVAYLHAAGLARQAGARLTLLHVDEVVDFGFHTAEEMAAYIKAVAERTNDLLDRARQEVAAQGVEVRVQTAAGAPAAETMRVAQQLGADLIVVAKQGVRGLERLLLGSTTTRVVRQSRLPVLVVPVKEGTEPPEALPQVRTMVAATDFSEDSQRGLDHTLALADILDARVVLTHVLRLPMLLPAIPGESVLVFPDDYKGRLEKDADQELAAMAERAGSPRLETRLRFDYGVAEALVDEAKKDGADLIVVPSHGKGAVAATLLGSTAERVLKLADRPVLVLPRSYLAAGAD